MRYRFLLPFVLTPAVCLTALDETRAQTVRVTGKVVNTLGVGVSGVDLDFEGVPVPGSTTGIGGTFDVRVPEDRYDVGFIPPTAQLAPRMLERVELKNNRNLGNIVLQPGFAVSGTVLSRARNPIPNVDVEVFDGAGQALFTPDDNTDVAGNFGIVLPAGIYRVEIRPPAGTDFVSHEILDLAVASTTPLGTLILPRGFPVTARVVHAQSRLPLANVDLDVTDALTGFPVFTPRDNTNGSGNVGLLLPIGLYHVSFSPPKGLPWVAQRKFNMLVREARDLGDVALEPGFTVSGTVLGPSGPVVGADIDVDTAPGGNRVFTPHDGTDALGRFSVVVPAGDYEVTVEPRSTNDLVGAATAVTVNGNTVIPTVGLVQGVVLSGTLTAFNGSPEIGADIDVVDPFTGTEVVLSGDQSDASGHYSIAVPPGTWDVRFDTRKLSGSRAETVSGVTVGGPTTLDRAFSLVPIAAYLDTLGIPSLPQGQPLIVDVGLMNLTPSGVVGAASVVLIDPDGDETFLVPPSFLLFPSFQPIAGFGLPVFFPPVNPAHLGQFFKLEIRVTDSAGNEFDSDRVSFIIR